MVVAVRTVSQIGLHMGVSFAVMYAVTGSLAFGGLAALLEPICNVIVMPIHDRFWKRIEEKVEARKKMQGKARVPGVAHAA